MPAPDGAYSLRACCVCGKEARMHWRQKQCGEPECKRARRRAAEAGVEGGLPAPTRPCEHCGKVFAYTRNQTCCSPECRKEKQRAAWRAYWHSLSLEEKREYQRKTRERRKANPEREKGINKRKWERTRDDPEKREQARRKSREHYHANREEIQARRRERLRNLSPEEFEQKRRKMRRYVKKHRDKVLNDPEKRERYREVRQEYLRRRAEAEALAGLATLDEQLQQRLESPPQVKACVECGQPVVGRHPSALCCSRSCERRRINRRLHPPRVVVCAQCGTEFSPRAARKLCSTACQRAVSARWKREHRKKLKQESSHEPKDRPHRTGEPLALPDNPPAVPGDADGETPG